MAVVAVTDEVASISFPLESRGDEAEEEEEDGDDDGEVARVWAAVGLPSREGGGS